MEPSSIGFLAPRQPVVADNPAVPKQHIPFLLRFDDGTGITMADANYNVLALGSTGSGKTSSAILPAIYNTFVAGYYGLILDIKGNLGPQIRALAKACGRKIDIVEFGTSKKAIRINLIGGMSFVELRNFFEDLYSKQGLTSGNEDFHQHGIEYVLDMCKFLQIVQKFDKRYTLSLEVIERLLRNPDEGHQLYAHFLEKWFNKHDQSHMQLYLALKNNVFHPLCQPLGNETEYWEQYAFATHGILGAINVMTATPAIVKNFFSGNNKLDFKSLIYDQKKVVILRFAAQAEAAGEILSRILLSMFYRVMLSPCGLQVPKNEKTFVIIDEFQQLMDLSGRFSDDKVLARSREFNNIFLVATQSMAGMYAKADDKKNAVHAMLTNFREKLIFNCDDPDTYEWIQRYGVDARCLPLGEVVALRGRESADTAGANKSLHNAHAHAQKLVKAASTQGCDICEVAPHKDEIPPIAQYQKPHRKLNNIFATYRNAEIEFPVPITLKDFTGIPNREMWLELTKKFLDCFEWQTQKPAQIAQLFNKPELNSLSMGHLCKTLSRIKAVGLLPKIRDFRFQENVLVLESTQGEAMDRVINMIAADTTLQKEQEPYAEWTQDMHHELCILQQDKARLTYKLQSNDDDDDDDDDCTVSFNLSMIEEKIEELLDIIDEVDTSAHSAAVSEAVWCIPCMKKNDCTIYKTLSCAKSQKHPKKRTRRTTASDRKGL